MTISEHIKALRIEHNLTQRALAKQLHVTDKTISKWETGKSIPDLSTLQKLADIFDINLDHLLNFKKRNPSQTMIRWAWWLLVIPNGVLYTALLIVYPVTSKLIELLLLILLIISITAALISSGFAVKAYLIGLNSTYKIPVKKLYRFLLGYAFALIVVGILKNALLNFIALAMALDILFIGVLIALIVFVKKHRFTPGNYQRLLWGLFTLFVINYATNLLSRFLPFAPPFPFPWPVSYALMIGAAGLALMRYTAAPVHENSL